MCIQGPMQNETKFYDVAQGNQRKAKNYPIITSSINTNFCNVTLWLA